jgi:hypothetical protein
VRTMPLFCSWRRADAKKRTLIIFTQPYLQLRAPSLHRVTRVSCRCGLKDVVFVLTRVIACEDEIQIEQK